MKLKWLDKTEGHTSHQSQLCWGDLNAVSVYMCLSFSLNWNIQKQMFAQQIVSLFSLLFFPSQIFEEYVFFMQSHVSPFAFPGCSCLVTFCFCLRAEPACIPIQNTLLHLCFPTFKSHWCCITAHTHTQSWFLLRPSYQKVITLLPSLATTI